MHRRQFHAVCAATAFAAGHGSLLAADDKDQWGNLSATFRYDGEPPAPLRLKIDKDLDAIKGPLFDPSLVVDAKSKGIANVVAWLYLAKDMKVPAIHPSHAEASKKEVTITYRNAQFEPHVSAIRTGQTLVFRNVDHIGHIAKGDFFRNGAVGDIIPASGEMKRIFRRPEVVPSPIACAIHSWMGAYILIKDHPYFGISDGQGKLTISHLPVGKHTFCIWHELPTFLKDIKRNGTVEIWNLGRVTVDIKPGDNDLGEIVCKPERPR